MERLLADEMAERWHYRRVLEPRATYLAECLWWRRFPYHECQRDLRGIMYDAVRPSAKIEELYRSALDNARLSYPGDGDAIKDAMAEAEEEIAEKFPFTRAHKTLVDEVLDDAISQVGAAHEVTDGLIVKAVTDALRVGADRQGCIKAALAIARDRMPMLPPHMVTDAIEKAARSHRFDVRFWRQRERSVG